MIETILPWVVALTWSGHFERVHVREWVDAVRWLADIECADDCWSILDYDLLEWPEGRTALDACLIRFDAHFSRPDRTTSCERWESLLETPDELYDLALDLSMSRVEAVRWLSERMKDDRCDWTRGDQLRFRADEATAELAARYDCTWTMAEANERRVRLGIREIDDTECWSGDLWRKFYDAPEAPER